VKCIANVRFDYNITCKHSGIPAGQRPASALGIAARVPYPPGQFPGERVWNEAMPPEHEHAVLFVDDNRDRDPRHVRTSRAAVRRRRARAGPSDCRRRSAPRGSSTAESHSRLRLPTHSDRTGRVGRPR